MSGIVHEMGTTRRRSNVLYIQKKDYACTRTIKAMLLW